jgi:hypothetical protein
MSKIKKSSIDLKLKKKKIYGLVYLKVFIPYYLDVIWYKYKSICVLYIIIREKFN